MIERSNITIRLAADVNVLLGRILDVVAAAVVALVLGAIAWQIWLFAAKMARAHETTFVLQIPIAPFWFSVDAILWCAVLVQAIVLARDVARRSPDDAFGDWWSRSPCPAAADFLAQIPIGFAMMIVGVVGLALQTNWGPALTILATEPVSVLSNVDLATVPLFLLMGTFTTAAGLSSEIYNAVAAVLGHRRGGLA